MRVAVTLIGPDGTMRRRLVDTAASIDAAPWEELVARALARSAALPRGSGKGRLSSSRR